jgi:hypothetical protein
MPVMEELSVGAVVMSGYYRRIAICTTDEESRCKVIHPRAVRIERELVDCENKSPCKQKNLSKAAFTNIERVNCFINSLHSPRFGQHNQIVLSDVKLEHKQIVIKWNWEFP